MLIVTGYAKGIKGGNEAAGNESYYSQTELFDFSNENCDSIWPTFPIKGGVDGAQGCLDVHSCIILSLTKAD